MSNNNFVWPVGTTYLFNIPPGAILGGTIVEVFDDVLVLKDVVYFEAIKNGASYGDYAFAATSAALEKVSERNWPLPDGYVVRKDCITHAAPCQMTFARQARAKGIAAIKGA